MAIVRTNSSGSSAESPCKFFVQWRAFNLHQMVDRHGFRVRIEIGELRDQARACKAGFAHANDAAATDVHSGVADAIQRVEAILVVAGGNDFAVELGRRIEIVIVVVEPGVAQSLGLTRV